MVTLSLAAFTKVVIESCTINHFKLHVVVEVVIVSTIIVAANSHYCFYFVTT